MAFNDIELQKHKMVLNDFIEKRRPPVEIRDKVDTGYSFDKQTVLIFETRPGYKKPGEKVEIPIVKSVYEKTTDSWKIYWQRSNMKWISYEPVPSVKTLVEFLKVVDEDAMHCFWG